MPGKLLDTSPMTPSMPIAIVGLALRGPGDASNSERFWQMLTAGHSARCEVPKDRYNVDGFYHPNSDRLGSIQQRHAHFMKTDFKAFDAPFFSIIPKEAKAMDPTHRMLLEVTYEGFENAGLTLDAVKGSKTSCYIGTFTGDFEELQVRDNEGPSMYHATGLSSSLASNRLSWFYDLKGPSMTIDTACSSSLTAFHLACQSLRTGEATMSVVGGANLMFGPDMSILLGAAKILSADGKSQMWDAKANGFSRGEGIGVTILKPLDAALRDGDTIRAVVLASAANQDGRTPGISLPNADAQEELIRTAYAQAGVDPAETGYVEAHGTGTQAGDPLEARAIINSIGSGRTSDLYVGSVKTNIGHLEGAAGVAGVIKAALAVERGLIPQNLWFETLNPQISLPDRVKIPQQLTEWPSEGPRRASINSFGFGGANAHVILEDAAHYLSRQGLNGRYTTKLLPPASNGTTNGQATGHMTENVNGGFSKQSDGDHGVNLADSKPSLLVISAQDQDGVQRSVKQLQEYLEENRDEKDPRFISNLAYTLASHRSIMPWKTYAIASDAIALNGALGEVPAAVRSSDSQTPKAAFIFTGQGAQWFAMGKDLVTFDVYKDSLADAERILQSLGCQWSLREELNKTKETSRLHLAELSQPVCTALQVALVDLLQYWDVRPSAVVGHSSGEIAAAYCIGAISKETAIRIAWLRGKYATSVAEARNIDGTMMAVNADGESIRSELTGLNGTAVVSCLNSPNACTVSGDVKTLQELEEILKVKGIVAKRLEVQVAYHSPHMNLIRQEYEAALRDGWITQSGAEEPSIEMFSSVTGCLITRAELDPSYWGENLVSPVNFVGAVGSLLNHSTDSKRQHDRAAFASIFIEVGPHSALRSYLLDIFKAQDKFVNLSYVTVLRRNYPGTRTILDAMGQLHVKGLPFNLNKVNGVSPKAQMLVDLPPYPFNHSLTFWEESYLSRDYRLREQARKDLLGYRNPGTSEPTWRNFLRCSENPWIREHQVQGNILYPGAGMLVMAIEAAHELADPNDKIVGYELRDVSIVAALRVPDDDKGVETMVQFHPRRTGTKAEPSSTLNEFTVSTPSEDGKTWTTHCRGLISVTYRSQLSPAMRQELELEDKRYRTSFQAAKKQCSRPARSFLYDNVETIGMNYGKIFRNITDLYAGDQASYGVITIPDTKASMPQNFEYPCVIHPVTLDSILHLLFPSIAGSEQSLQEAVVPFSFDRIFINADIPSAPGTELYGYTAAQKTSYTTWMSTIAVSTEEWSTPLILIEGLGLASLGASETAQDPWKTRAGCFDMIWHEDPEFLTPTHVKELIYKRTTPNNDDDSVLDKLEFVCLVYIHHILDWISSSNSPHCPPPAASLNAAIQEARDSCILSKSGDITVQMVDRIGQNLERIFMQEIEPLQVMLEGDLLYDFYRGAFGASFNTNVAEYVGLIADKSPGLRILEIGAGTGGTTYHVLERLRNPDGTSKARNYTFTDISPGFLAKAAERFSEDAAILEFSALNIEEDPLAHGFQTESFDLIVCANVLHATRSIQETLAHCRWLLKPEGKLVLSEVTIKRIFSGFIMGPLPGWWLGEDDGRKGGPLLNAEEWDLALKQAGFSGVDLDVRGDCDTSLEPVSLLASTKTSGRPNPSQAFAIIKPAGDPSNKLAAHIETAFQYLKLEVSVFDWTSVTESDIKGKYCVCLSEWAEPLLAMISDEDWNKFRTLVSTASGALWVTGGAAMECSNPHGGLMVGLSRAIRNENSNCLLATLDIDPQDSTVDLANSALAIRNVAVRHSYGDLVDHEFAARGQTVYIPRVERAPQLDSRVRLYQSKGEPEEVNFVACQRPLKLTIKSPGLLDSFLFEEDMEYYEALPEDWVEIQVKAVGLNFKDVLVALGNLNENKLGVDVSGVVTRVGSAVSNISVGDRVMTSSCNTFATFVRFPMQGVIPIPDDMSFEDAASMPLIFLTAYYALVTVGRLQPGETVLIHAAAGGVGQAAIAVAQHIGAEIYATVGSPEKRQLLIDQYGIPDDNIFSSRDTSFAKGVMRATNGSGVDVVLNSLAGEALRLSWNCLAKFGRFLEIGKADLFANTGLDMLPFLENKSYCGVNLIDFENNPTPRAVALFQSVAELIKDRVIKPVKPVQVFSFSEIEKAFRYMQTGKHMGKIVVRVDENDLVPAIPLVPEARITPEATYILAGGLGGICREISRWLAEKGAKHLVFLSRSAATGDANIAFMKNLRETYGVNAIAFDCDVADRASLERALDGCKEQGLPPVRGCVTGAMVLRDTLFDGMTIDHLRTTVGPKVHGTWNLHDMLPKDLDFFVMLSSLAGVMGHRGQGNYGAGNIFQDYFASFRRSQGLRAMTIDIGYLLSVGFVAEHDEYVDHVKSMGLKVMQNSDLHALMSIAMEDTPAHPAQVMCGLPTNEYSEAWYWIQDGKFASLLNTAQGGNTAMGSSISLGVELARMTDMTAAVDLIHKSLVEKLAKLMMVPMVDIDPGKPLSAYGVDSLVAVEVRNWIAKEIQVELSVFDIMALVPMRQLAADLAAKSKLLSREGIM
ncbi:Highly reducing polyketide synthase [Penicillium canescens]|uniref:Highly reducing polyketide synthase n=1 Tax=Penicillium canescens TaxID=5083 RepID=UPI0026DF5662|nr:Highly reducing polyketide synthase [Penicillium canescens]KAJ6045303.1 Highly reducing polyketide synthase [Penicillium canescens]